jgi:hypothetical protein
MSLTRGSLPRGASAPAAEPARQRHRRERVGRAGRERACLEPREQPAQLLALGRLEAVTAPDELAQAAALGRLEGLEVTVGEHRDLGEGQDLEPREPAHRPALQESTHCAAGYPWDNGVMRATLRCWLPMIAGLLCLVVSRWTGPLATWLLLLAGIALVFDGATALFVKATGAGGLRDNRQ